MKHFGLGIMFLCLLWGPCMECSAQQASTPGGNRVLMEEWQSRQTAIKQEIYDKLKKEGKLPRNGRIEFEARVKADPKSKNKVQLQIENLRIIDQSQSKSGSTEVPARGKGSSDAHANGIRIPEVELRNIELKGGEFIRDYIEFRDIDLPGAPAVAKANVANPVEESKVPEQPPQVPQAEKPAPPEPEQKSWWKRLFGL
jgi:hypothetical protein